MCGEPTHVIYVSRFRTSIKGAKWALLLPGFHGALGDFLGSEHFWKDFATETALKAVMNWELNISLIYWQLRRR